MARIVEQTLTITLSRLVRDDNAETEVVSDEQLVQLISTLPSVCEQVLDDAAVIIEIS